MAYSKIKPRRGTASQWTTTNPVLAEGEIGIEVPDGGVGTGLVQIKFGDGVTAWNDLPYGVIKNNFSIEDYIVQNLETEATDKVPSVSAVKAGFDEVNNNLETLGGFTPIINETGKITGYTTKIGGADTVFPFSSFTKMGDTVSISLQLGYSLVKSDLPEDKFYFCIIKVISGAGAFGQLYCDSNGGNVPVGFQTNTGYQIPVGTTFIVSPYGHGNMYIKAGNNNWINTVVEIDVYGVDKMIV